MSAHSFYVLAYDIPDDRRRTKIAKLCESVAERVQGNVFEGYLSPQEVKSLLNWVARVLETEEDNLRFYLLCAGCRQKVTSLGRGQVTQPPDVIIV